MTPTFRLRCRLRLLWRIYRLVRSNLLLICQIFFSCIQALFYYNFICLIEWKYYCKHQLTASQHGVYKCRLCLTRELQFYPQVPGGVMTASGFTFDKSLKDVLANPVCIRQMLRDYVCDEATANALNFDEIERINSEFVDPSTQWHFPTRRL